MVLLTLKFANTFKVRRGCLQGHSPRPWVVAHADEPNQGETEIAHAKHGQPPSETIKTKHMKRSEPNTALLLTIIFSLIFFALTIKF